MFALSDGRIVVYGGYCKENIKNKTGSGKKGGADSSRKTIDKDYTPFVSNYKLGGLLWGKRTADGWITEQLCTILVFSFQPTLH